MEEIDNDPASALKSDEDKEEEDDDAGRGNEPSSAHASVHSARRISICVLSTRRARDVRI